MDAESFFQRWSKPKTAESIEPQPSSEPTPATTAVEAEKPPPTMDDVAHLTLESDFKPFVARGVDEDVRRLAMKKLFSDPQFNVMDGLDTYIEDYNKFEPIPAAMLAALNHAQALLHPGEQIEKSLMQLLQTPEEAPPEPAQDNDEPEPGITGADTETTPDEPSHDDAI